MAVAWEQFTTMHVTHVYHEERRGERIEMHAHICTRARVRARERNWLGMDREERMDRWRRRAYMHAEQAER